MGVLFRGVDPVLDREVAIKLMLVDFSNDAEDMRPRFYREARAAAKLGFRVRTDGIARLFHPDELSASAVEPEAGWERLMPHAVALYRELDALADLPAGAPARPGRRYTLDTLRGRAAAARLRRELARIDAETAAVSA